MTVFIQIFLINNKTDEDNPFKEVMNLQNKQQMFDGDYYQMQQQTLK